MIGTGYTLKVPYLLNSKLMKRFSLFTLCIACFPVSQLCATKVGEIAQDFTLQDYVTQEDVKLSDFEGKILILDFFAWWCAPCRASSPILVEDVEKHFADNGGNQHGVPVSVLGVNIFFQLPQNTDEFIENAGMEHVANDPDPNLAFNQFAISGGVPLFVIINGVSDSPTYQQWEVLEVIEGFTDTELARTALVNDIKSVVNQVQPASSPAPFSSGASNLGGQWYKHDWFGTFYAQDENWYYHETLGWVFIEPTDNSSAWMYLGNSLGWCWTSQATYPFFYKISNTPSWIYYQVGSAEPRRFYYFSTETWQSK